MASSFDLFRNPFVLLGLDLSASAKQVADAFEDAVADGHASEPELVAARQAILTPLLRLEAEVGALPDTPSREWRSILVALKSSQTITSLRQAFANIASLSRSNLLTHIASRVPPDAPTLAAWLAAQGTINLDEVHREIEQFREIAGVVRPDRRALSSALSNLKEQQARALFDGFVSPADAIGVVTICTKEIISSQNDDQIDALSSLLNAYNRHIAQELSFRRERVTSTAAALRSDPDGPGNVAIVVDALRFWDQAGQPLQLLEAHKGRDEPSSQEVFQEIRSLAIDLANDLSRFDVALSITKACQEVFAKLPRAVQQLSEDQAVLEERIVSSKVNPLAIAIGELGDDLHKLVSDLRRDGFGRESVGSAKALRDAFVTSVKSSKGSTVADLPWLMLRSITVKLNNELAAPDSALALVTGLLDLARELDVSEDVFARLREDKRAIERNQLEGELLGHLKEGRLGAASSVIENLLQDYKSPDERNTLQKLKSDLKRKKIGQYFRWGFWPAVVLVGIILANIDRSPPTAPRPFSNPSSIAAQQPLSNPSVQTTPPRPVRNFVEEMPPIGTDRNFSEGNIRYCMFQKVRLEIIQPRISTNYESGEFNRLVDDYNSRCGSYRYIRSDRNAVEAELIQKRPDLMFQAERILSEWRPRQPGAQSVPLTSPSVATTPPQALLTPAAPYLPPPISAPAASSLPPPISIAEAPELNIRPSLDLLRLADASRVQGRLIELGFTKGPADGTWGPQSRSALRAFRAANGLPASDAWDASVAERLFSTDAVRASGAPISQKVLPDAIFTPPAGATMNPLNREDAIRIHSRLRELGTYQGKNSSIWSLASRAALREFKAKNGLPPDDDWDAITEQQLFNSNAVRIEVTDEERFNIVFSGAWVTNLIACPGSGAVSDALPLTITRNRAEAGDASCDFRDVKSDGERWLIKAQCQSDNKSWVANIALTRIGNQIKWSSERGTTTYYRCGS
jgi:peptidoglycan hydrolase-like protein with peptidoglycan-binding domain